MIFKSRSGPAAAVHEYAQQAEFSGVAQFAVGGSAVSLGMSAGALRHLQLPARLSGASGRWGADRGVGHRAPAR